MMMLRTLSLVGVLVLLSVTHSMALSTSHSNVKHQHQSTTRRQWAATAAAFLVGTTVTTTIGMTAAPAVVHAAEDNVVMTEEEMAARVARKLALQKSAANPNRSSLPVGATDVRSDVNPEAAVNLRSRSLVENAKVSFEKQEEMKKRDKTQKREDMCEMLGRGC
jgi:hypothetical protein